MNPPEEKVFEVFDQAIEGKPWWRSATIRRLGYTALLNLMTFLSALLARWVPADAAVFLSLTLVASGLTAIGLLGAWLARVRGPCGPIDPTKILPGLTCTPERAP